MGNWKKISWRAAMFLWLTLFIAGGLGGAVISKKAHDPYLGFAILGIIGMLISIIVFYILPKSNSSPGLLVVVIVGIVTTVGGGIAVWLGVTDDGYPTVKSEVIYLNQQCKETVITVKAEVADPDTWGYDSGLSSATVNGRTYPATPHSGVWDYSFIHTFYYTNCDGDFQWQITAADVSGNSTTVTFAAPVPHPLCCNPTEAEIQGCKCEDFKK